MWSQILIENSLLSSWLLWFYLMIIHLSSSSLSLDNRILTGGVITIIFRPERRRRWHERIWSPRWEDDSPSTLKRTRTTCSVEWILAPWIIFKLGLTLKRFGLLALYVCGPTFISSGLGLLALWIHFKHGSAFIVCRLYKEYMMKNQRLRFICIYIHPVPFNWPHSPYL